MEDRLMTILAVLQARLSSSRLPGKVLKPILGEPMLFRQIERIRRTKLIDRLIIASSDDKSDDPLVSLLQERHVECFRGSLDDVLDRFYKAALPYMPEHVVRLTGDCPLADPEVIDAVIRMHLENGYDYSSNALEPTYPDGLDVEVVRFSCLKEAWQEAVLVSQREHVMPFINSRPERYRLGSLRSPVDMSDLRWTVDEQADFDLVSRIYEALYPGNPDFSTGDILELLNRNAELQTLNTGIARNEGFVKSLAKDRARLSEGGS